MEFMKTQLFLPMAEEQTISQAMLQAQQAQAVIMARIFDNPQNLTASVILSRLNEAGAQANPYTHSNTETGALTHYVAIDSQKIDDQITTLLAGPITTDELDALTNAELATAQLRAEYKNTITQLQTIQNTTNPTNTQVIAAV